MEHTMANLSLQTTPSTRTIAAPALLNLPVEILIKISQNLCLHCRLPRIGEVPHVEAASAIDDDQTALARLSATCRHLRAIAQPILFHFFHSLANYDYTRLRLARFAHALFHRRDLASCVRSLVLWTPDLYHLRDMSREEAWRLALKDVDRAGCFQRAAEELGPWWEGRWYGSLEGLQELTIALAPAATYVLLQRRFCWYAPLTDKTSTAWTAWTGRPMEHLRHVVLVGWRKWWPREDYSFHLKEARAFLRHASNLESLVAAECGADGLTGLRVSDYDELKASPWDVEFPRLRKLSLSGKNIGVEEVEAIIRHSTVFEDLELFYDGVFVRPVLDLERHLGTAKKTLKRLCYSAFSIKARLMESDVCDEEYEGTDSDDDEDWFDPTRHGLWGFKVGFSLRDFSALETLELEQLVLYGPVFEEPDKMESDRSGEVVTTDEFLAKFPPSLVRLRIGCIFYWPIVFRDMLAMAEERARFPKFRSVALEVRRIPPREEFDCLVETFRKVGIALSICSVVRDPFSRGMLPTRPGFPVLLPEPVSYT